MDINKVLTKNLAVKEAQVAATIKLLDEGATVPFIARYRKEVTGGLTDVQLRDLESQLTYLRELEQRRQTVLKSIQEQGKLTPELEQTILAVDNKATLEDIYLPFKPKRRTKAQIAKEAGLEPLAMRLYQHPNLNPEQEAAHFINPDHQILDVNAALEGTQQILMELFSENAELIGKLREQFWQQAILKSHVVEDKRDDADSQKFADYFAYQEPIKRIPSHRALAFFRGQRLEILRLNLILSDDENQHFENELTRFFQLTSSQAASDWLQQTLKRTWRIKLLPRLELDNLVRLREQAELEAIKVFGKNLKDLLMAAPAGARVTMGLDPGLRTGVKVVVVDATGKLLAHTVIYPHAPKNEWDAALITLAKLCETYHVNLISIGNGTASRETDKLVTELIKVHPKLNLIKLVVSEAGASVYSASALASKEFPDLDVSYRGAISIARRLQDPLAELVKIDPKSIGVGQYQHDVSQTQLARTLDAVVEDCVNAVGVDINMASAALLARISGLNETLAQHIVSYRNQHGAFKERSELKKVARLGEKTFEQAAGFLRIMNGINPLDASAVHPESYPVVQKILAQHHQVIETVIGNQAFLKSLNAADYADEHFGVPTVVDIIKELEKPGRDPRPEFKTADFKEGVHSLEDLKLGMILEGVITNITNFGAFVDIGVHQDGLVHKSMMAERFVKDPHEIVKVGDIVKVKVIAIDLARQRASLSMRLQESSATPSAPATVKSPAKKSKPIQPATANSLTEAFLNAFKKQKN